MSRVHDALRKASQEKFVPSRQVRTDRIASRIEEPVSPRVEPPNYSSAPPPPALPSSSGLEARPEIGDLESVIASARGIAYNPKKDALVANIMQPREAPAEEFRMLRTKLIHLQESQPLHTLVITSASPAEGKSFTAANLAISQAQIANKRVLLADFDFRRPTVHNTFQIPGSPGLTDFLTGKAKLSEIIYRVSDTNLYMIPAGGAVPNPLELLNLQECRILIDELRNHFDWAIFDSPPLLFAADANLLSTMCDGTLLVVRIGTTTYDSVTRAMQSLCENNVLGVVVNGARRGELYSKYSYYHDYYSPESQTPSLEAGDEASEDETTPVHSHS